MATLLDGSPLPTSDAGWIEAAKRYQSGGITPSTASSGIVVSTTTAASTGSIFARRTDTAGFNQFLATSTGTKIQILNGKKEKGAEIEIPTGWTLESAAFNNNPAKGNTLLCTFKKGTEANTSCWCWNHPTDVNLKTSFIPADAADLTATPGAPWPKPPQ